MRALNSVVPLCSSFRPDAGSTEPKSRHSQLARICDEEIFAGRYRIQSVRYLSRPNGGDKHWRLQLVDHSGTLEAYADGSAFQVCERQAGFPVFDIEALARWYKGQLYAELRHAEPTTVQPGEALDVLPRPLCQPPEKLDRLVEIVRSLSVPALRDFVDIVLRNDAVALPFLSLPGSLIHHHAHAGGLLEHSIEVAEIVASLPSFSIHEQEIAIVAALFHDIGKTRTLDRQGRMTAAGHLVNHDAFTLELCAPGLKRLDQTWPEAAQLLRHIWTASYSGSRYGTPPKSAVVQAVRMADRFSAEQAKDATAFRDQPAGRSHARIGNEMRWRISPPSTAEDQPSYRRLP